MNKLYFRAWLKDEKKMCNVTNIYSLDNCTEVTCQVIGGEENDYADYRLNEVILMQGIEIDDQVVYVGDVIERDTGWNFLKTEIKSLYHLVYFQRRPYEVNRILGNIYENKELVECN